MFGARQRLHAAERHDGAAAVSDHRRQARLCTVEGAIERYCRTWNLRIVKCYEEQETAAKQGRPVFLDMLKAVKQGKAEGLIVHKIDRGAVSLPRIRARQTSVCGVPPVSLPPSAKR